MEEGVSPSLSRNGFSFSSELGFSDSLSVSIFVSVSFYGWSSFPEAIEDLNASLSVDLSETALSGGFPSRTKFPSLGSGFVELVIPPFRPDLGSAPDLVSSDIGECFLLDFERPKAWVQPLPLRGVAIASTAPPKKEVCRSSNVGFSTGAKSTDTIIVSSSADADAASDIAECFAAIADCIAGTDLSKKESLRALAATAATGVLDPVVATAKVPLDLGGQWVSSCYSATSARKPKQIDGFGSRVPDSVVGMGKDDCDGRYNVSATVTARMDGAASGWYANTSGYGSADPDPTSGDVLPVWSSAAMALYFVSGDCYPIISQLGLPYTVGLWIFMSIIGVLSCCLAVRPGRCCNDGFCSVERQNSSTSIGLPAVLECCWALSGLNK